MRDLNETPIGKKASEGRWQYAAVCEQGDGEQDEISAECCEMLSNMRRPKRLRLIRRSSCALIIRPTAPPTPRISFFLLPLV